MKEYNIKEYIFKFHWQNRTKSKEYYYTIKQLLHLCYFFQFWKHSTDLIDCENWFSQLN